VTIKNATLLSGVLISVTAAAVAVDRRSRPTDRLPVSHNASSEPLLVQGPVRQTAPPGRAWRWLLALGIALALALAAFGIANDGAARLVCTNHAGAATSGGHVVCIAPQAHRNAVRYVDAGIGALLASAALALLADLWERRRAHAKARFRT
jgi:hypothetical protein